MKKIIISILFLLTPFFAYAQQKPSSDLICMPMTVMIANMVKAGMVPIFRSEIEKGSGVMVAINPEARRMIILVYAYNPEQKAVGSCILGSYDNLDYDKEVLNTILESLVGHKT